MIVVTGGAGFIGSNIVKALNAKAIKDILVVDDLTDGKKFTNLVDCEIADYMDKDEFLTRVKADNFAEKIEVIFHEGACSTTTEWDGQYMMANNYSYSKDLLHFAANNGTAFIYASSAAVYGAETTFVEELANEKPLNVYGYSKFQFDQYVRKHWSSLNNQVVGLRYFNVYGPREQHKGSMASVAFHFNNQIKENRVVKLFEGTDGYADGEQLRDFIFVDDVVKVNLWFMENSSAKGIFNLGTGKAQSFNDVAKAVIAWHNTGAIEYIPFPEKLRGCYQSFTQADISKLRAAGYQDEFSTVEQGVKAYLDRINPQPK